MGETLPSDLGGGWWWVVQEHETTHERGTGQRKWGLRAAETKIANRGPGKRNAQKLVYPTHRSSFERCVVKTDNGAVGASSRNCCCVGAILQESGEKEEGVEEHPGCQ